MSRVPSRLVWTCVSAVLWTLPLACSDETQPPGPSLSSPQERDEEEAASKPPPKARRSKNAVTYTIARGGTLLNVANLYKLHHHEIISLNPEIDPQLQLGPKTEVVVHDGNPRDSESIGLPHGGELRDGVPMSNGPGRLITAERWKTWATQSTVRQLDTALKAWASQFPKGPPVLVGNLSARSGGPLAPHKTHQSGRDVDLSYIAKWDGTERVTWQKMNSGNLDAAKTWKLLQTLVAEGEVETIFIDRRIQKLLLNHARRHGNVRKQQLSEWLEVARPKRQRRKALIRHVPGHDDHMHVRYSCRPDEKRCQS